MNLFKLPDKVYDFFVKIATVVIPALTVLLTTLGTIWGWSVGEIVQSIGAVAIFLGAVLGIANAAYNKAGGGVAGEITTVDHEGVQSALVAFNDDPGQLVDGQKITLVVKTGDSGT